MEPKTISAQCFRCKKMNPICEPENGVIFRYKKNEPKQKIGERPVIKGKCSECKSKGIDTNVGTIVSEETKRWMGLPDETESVERFYGSSDDLA